jgi:hypothetical protein
MMDELEMMRKGEDINYNASRKLLGNSIFLVRDICNLYRCMIEFLMHHKDKNKDENVAIAHFILYCKYNLLIASLSLLRGHLSDSFYISRKAIEIGAFAARVKKHAHLATLWRDASDEDQSYEKYRKKFSPSKLFNCGVPLEDELCKLYDFCSKYSHPSYYSIVRQIDEDEENKQISFKYFELNNRDLSEPIRILLWTISTHYRIIKLFEELLNDIIKPYRQEWGLKIKELLRKMAYYKSKWKDVIFND